jgi:DNA modification methylase
MTRINETAITYSECYAQVFLGDCLELYKNLEPKSIDLILTDLPYGTTACKWDTIIPFDKLWEMVNYLLKLNGAFITTASEPFASALRMSNIKDYKYEWYWKKNIPSGFQLATIQPQRCIENIIVFYKKQPVYNKQLRDTIINDRKIKDGAKNGNGYFKKSQHNLGTKPQETTINLKVTPVNFIDIKCVPRATGYLHPTQKPVELMQYLLKTYSNEGMIIFDPCMGSGTTGVACKNLNRNFIGIEKDEAYFKIAEQRINARTLFS